MFMVGRVVDGWRRSVRWIVMPAMPSYIALSATTGMVPMPFPCNEESASTAEPPQFALCDTDRGTTE